MTMLNLKIPEDLQALYRSGEILAGMGYNSGGYMCRLIEHIATLTQKLAEAEARVRVLDNTLDVERDAFRNMQMQKEALEARNKRLAAPVSDEEMHKFALHYMKLGTLNQINDRPVLTSTQVDALIAARAALADERKEVQGE